MLQLFAYDFIHVHVKGVHVYAYNAKPNITTGTAEKKHIRNRHNLRNLLSLIHAYMYSKTCNTKVVVRIKIAIEKTFTRVAIA